MGQKEPFGSLWGYAASASETFRTVSLRSTLAIRLHSKPPRLVVQRMLAELLPCRFLHATRKKSAPGPTTLCAPNRAHQRRSDEPCGTRPPDAARHPLPASSADAQTKRPARTVPREPVWFFGSLTPTTVSVSQIPDVYASLGRLLPAASASQTNRESSADPR